jgi:hypothetical protein
MTRYDLSRPLNPQWARFTFAFRIGMGAFAIILLVTTAYGVYRMVTGAGLDLPHLIGTGLIFFILGIFLLISILMRPAATGLVIDEKGVRLEYKRGQPYAQGWSDPNFVIRGQWTRGASGPASRGGPQFSIYGKQGGFSVTFVPETAYRELVVEAASRGLILAERHKGPDKVLYSISPRNA